ncbi:hypothetical protein KR093_001547 [Drosophila rubida]|uniref:Glycine-rich cell wall structural protein n=1 Tax=Drosophila rubida TaxID=30044 RepID=A0AAD4PT81_9MUSC|nr:hypothetical protein KR093_001547 [Drosophila rubida]
MKISCALLVLCLFGSSYAQYQYPGAGAAATGARPSSAGPAGAVDNRIIGLNGLLGGGGGGGGGGPLGGLFGNLLGGILGGGNNARPSFGQQGYPAPLPSYGGGYPGYGGVGFPGYGGALGNGYAGNYPGVYPGNNYGGGFGPGYGNYYG